MFVLGCAWCTSILVHKTVSLWLQHSQRHVFLQNDEKTSINYDTSSINYDVLIPLLHIRERDTVGRHRTGEREGRRQRERETEGVREKVRNRHWLFFFFTPEKWTVPLVNKGALIKKWDIPLAQMWPKNKFLVNEIQHPAFADDI